MYSWKVLVTATLPVEDFWFLKDNSTIGNRFPKRVVQLLVWLGKPPGIKKRLKKFKEFLCPKLMLES